MLITLCCRVPYSAPMPVAREEFDAVTTPTRVWFRIHLCSVPSEAEGAEYHHQFHKCQLIHTKRYSSRFPHSRVNLLLENSSVNKHFKMRGE